MGKYIKKVDTGLLSAVEVYKLVLSRKLKAFPAGFWSEADGKENAKEITRHLIEEILMWSDEDIKKNYNGKLLIEYKLNGMKHNCFGNNLFQVLENAYPGKFMPWEMLKVSPSFWNDDNCRLAVKWLIEDRLKLDLSNPKRKINLDDFKENGLFGMLNTRFRNCPYKAIDFIYPGKFKEWEITKTVRGFWIRENAIIAVRWLFEEKLKWSDHEIKKNVTAATFSDNGLKGMMTKLFDGSPYKALDAAYPGRFMETDLQFLPSGYWTKERCCEALRDLLENKLKWTREDIVQNFNNDVFIENGLFSVLRVYKRGVAALQDAYPGEFKDWEFVNSKNIRWTREKAIEAVKWLIEEKLKWTEDDVRVKIKGSIFIENNLYGALLFFGQNPGRAVMEAYPGRYQVWEFMQVPKGFWNRENGIKATKWLIEEKLHLGQQDIKSCKPTNEIFKEHQLSAMLRICFENSGETALKEAYPDLFASNGGIS